MATATDNFDRTENPLSNGGVWSHDSNFGNPFTTNGTVCTPTADADAATFWNGSPLASVGADQYAQLAITTITGGAANDGSGLGVCCRWASGASTGYRVVVSAAATNNVEVSKFVNAAYTLISTTRPTSAFATGDILRLEVTGQNAAIVVTVKKALAASPTSFSTIFTQGDSSTINSGFPGLAFSGAVGLGDTGNNWEGGDLVSVTWEQEDYRWRNDNGNETDPVLATGGATYINAENTPL